MGGRKCEPPPPVVSLQDKERGEETQPGPLGAEWDPLPHLTEGETETQRDKTGGARSPLLAERFMVWWNGGLVVVF